MITVKTISTEQEFVSLREKWDSIVEAACLDLSNSYEWSMCLLESHLRRRETPVIIVEDERGPLGIFPFFCKKKSSNLMPIINICPLSHLYSVHNDLIIRERDLEVLDIFFQELVKIPESRNWRIMEIPYVVVEGKTDELIKTYIAARGLKYKIHKSAASPFIKIDGRTWSEYLSSRNSKVRGNFRRRQKNIQQAGKVQIDWVTSPDEILRILATIENRSWKYKAGKAITSKEEQRLFYELLIRRLSSRIRFLVLFLDGIPISYALSIIFNNKCYFLKTSYDEQYRKLSPGIIILLSLLKYCFDSKLREFDFAGEAEEHKLDFTSDIRHHNHYLIFNNNLYSQFLYKVIEVRDKLGFLIR